ncbi:MAG: hypothetical protein NC920_05905 [Candidatus Omnitrophica bacterium]|nr:hypothetical protein [Candidatus Omnitrophota bacterium]
MTREKIKLKRIRIIRYVGEGFIMRGNFSLLIPFNKISEKKREIKATAIIKLALKEPKRRESIKVNSAVRVKPRIIPKVNFSSIFGNPGKYKIILVPKRKLAKQKNIPAILNPGFYPHIKIKGFLLYGYAIT